MQHVYVKRQQAAFMQKQKSAVDGKNIVLQVDFSENASIAYQNEIQSVHWGYAQATLFTCYAWINENVSESTVIISNDLNHGKVAVYNFMNHIFASLKQKYPQIEKIDVFSDGASSQFKQKYLFSNLHDWQNQHQVQIGWNFFATSHGKGIVDGIGGTVKRTVWRHIKAGSSHATSAHDFYLVAKETNPNINVEFISKEKIQQSEQKLLHTWKQVRNVPNIRKMHTVRARDAESVFIGETSSSVLSVAQLWNCKDNDGETDIDTDETEIYDEQQSEHPPRNDVNMEYDGNENDDVRVCRALQMSIEDQEKHDETVDMHLKKLEEHVEDKFAVQQVPMDGNCFFWSLSWLMDRAGLGSYTHTELRKMVCDHMLKLSVNRKQEIAPFLQGTFNEYVSKMQKNGTYADHVVISEITSILKFKAFIHEPTTTTTVGEIGPEVHFGYIPEIGHYVALKPKMLLEEITEEKYYAVYYTDPFDFYIGRIIKKNCKCHQHSQAHLQMKFLRQNLITKEFYWPRKPQVECVPLQVLFAGPLDLSGTGPFKINLTYVQHEFQKIKKAFK